MQIDAGRRQTKTKAKAFESYEEHKKNGGEVIWIGKVAI
jgi:hypothetical protein